MSFVGKVTKFLNFGSVKINPFPKPVPCTTNQIFCQPTEQLDNIGFQFEVSESTELIINGNFNSASAGWTVVGWVIGFTDSGNQVGQQTTGVNALSQKGILTINDFYRVTLTVSNFPGGTLVVGGGSGSSIFNGVLTIQSNGTFTGFFQYNEGGGAGDFIIQGSAASSINIRVDDISVIKVSDVSDYDIQIIDQETGNLIDTVPVANMRLSENILTVEFNWADDLSVTNGCRQIQIIDNTNLFEDTFANNQGWTLGVDVTIAGGVMDFTDSGAACPSPVGFDCSANISNIFVIGESYEITYTTVNFSVARVAVFCGRTQGTLQSSNGTFVQELICTSITKLQFGFIGGVADSIQITSITIKKVNNIAGRSECYDLQTDHDCTLLFKWSNNESWGGFDYQTPPVGAGEPILAFQHQLRLESKFRGTKYPSARIIGDDSAGVKSMDYTSLRKVKILDIHRAPDYLHDAIAAFFMQDNRTIEDISYIMEDEYEPSAPNESRVLWKDLMTSRSELEETTQANLINRNL